jgi:hypothetical protein
LGCLNIELIRGNRMKDKVRLFPATTIGHT